MEILPTSGDQILKIIPRKDSDNPVIKLTNKDTRVTTTVTPTKTTEQDYMVLTATFTLSENTIYRYVVEMASDNNEEIYRGLIYASNQVDIQKYFINKDLYTEEDTFDNEFVII